MKKRQSGQVFILVLILLAIAAVMVIPVLNLTDTSLRSSQITTRQTRALYALDSAQEYVKWKLTYDGLGSEFTENGESQDLTFDCCGIPVDMTVVMRAVPGNQGIVLSTDDLMRPTKTVTASNLVTPPGLPAGYIGVAKKSVQTLTYIIRLEQLSSDTSQGLDAIYDILPKDFGSVNYIADSSYIRVDGGAWQSISNPLKEVIVSQTRLRWPASGSFASPIRDFSVRQVKEIKFQISLTMPNLDVVEVNWAVLAMGDIRTVSGPQAPIAVGIPANYNIYSTDGTPLITKVAEPDFILPGVEKDIKYTITIVNQSGDTLHADFITDYLPPDFFYITGTATIDGTPIAEPSASVQEINGLVRQVLTWSFPSHLDIAAGATKTMIFWALATKDVSGSYYNEVVVDADFTVPGIFSSIGVELEDYNVGYSWNAGSVVVPSYDSEAEADGVVLDANLALVTGGVSITSYQVR